MTLAQAAHLPEATRTLALRLVAQGGPPVRDDPAARALVQSLLASDPEAFARSLPPELALSLTPASMDYFMGLQDAALKGEPTFQAAVAGVRIVDSTADHVAASIPTRPDGELAETLRANLGNRLATYLNAHGAPPSWREACDWANQEFPSIIPAKTSPNSSSNPSARGRSAGAPRSSSHKVNPGTSPRKEAIEKGGYGIKINIQSNPHANGAAPIYEIPALSQVGRYAEFIDHSARTWKVDPDLVRAIIYVETTHGYYDAALAPFDANKSILPMNINTSYWGNKFGSREYLKAPKNNIDQGAKMLSFIARAMPGAGVDKIATVYNNLGADRVSDYGARVMAVYRAKPWQINVTPRHHGLGDALKEGESNAFRLPGGHPRE